MEIEDDESVEEGRIMKSGSGRGGIIEFFSRGFLYHEGFKPFRPAFFDHDHIADSVFH